MMHQNSRRTPSLTCRGVRRPDYLIQQLTQKLEKERDQSEFADKVRRVQTNVDWHDNQKQGTSRLHSRTLKIVAQERAAEAQHLSVQRAAAMRVLYQSEDQLYAKELSDRGLSVHCDRL
eukprot:GHVQ01024849.1.p2 GENE.GHVQ01024849.1~~GHVQ01024849.1.p2  ORF type:complete len:119 (+),score=16.98 GHVQ01024849.1:301-657(+)